MFLPVITPVLKGFIVIQLVKPFPALHEGELSTEADLLFCIGAAVEGARRPKQTRVVAILRKHSNETLCPLPKDAFGVANAHESLT